MLKSSMLFLASLGVSASAHAAADYSLNLTQSAAVDVYATARYTARVSNIGNKNGGSGTLTFTLPSTHTSPTSTVLGTVVGMKSGCTRSGLVVTCSVASIRKGRNASFWVDVAFPWSSAPIEIDARVTMTGSENTLANNEDSHVAVLRTVDTEIVGETDVTNRHCTGTNLTSFFECECFPSSISSHDIVFHADNTLSIPIAPEYEGFWIQDADDHLRFWYTYNGGLEMEFEGYGVGGDCFEGITTFPGSTYVSPYEVCLQ